MRPGHLTETTGSIENLKGKVGMVGVLRGDVDGSWTPPAGVERLADTWFGDLASRVSARLPDGGFDPSQWGVYTG
jgi:hypothetical protein